MSILKLNHYQGALKGCPILPVSKSECNRALILQYLSDGKVKPDRISDARDTATLLELLSSDQVMMNVKDAGTTMRFLLAYSCVKGFHRILTGTDRMKERPIGPLVDALRGLGFNINYLERKGFPPVEVLPVHLNKIKSEVEITGSLSSQYISALMMIAPLFQEGLRINILDEILSLPYIEMTRSMLLSCGINSGWENEHQLYIPHQQFQETVLSPESDWSAAGYWYSLIALSEDGDLLLPGLKADSLQGDAKIVQLMESFGVTTEIVDGGVRISKTGDVKSPSVIDFSDMPDMCQTIAVMCAALNVSVTFTGLSTLRIKETDRIAALQTELRKFGVSFVEEDKDQFLLSGTFHNTDEVISTYHDHRMAMAFAPLAMLGDLKIENPEVVQKSYPQFWNALESCGLVSEISY